MCTRTACVTSSSPESPGPAGPGHFVVDLRITKAFPIGNRRRIEAFLEGDNVTNYVTLIGGSTNMGLASFLLRTGARDARRIQWGARFVF
jgi:hypothetical protein